MKLKFLLLFLIVIFIFINQIGLSMKTKSIPQKSISIIPKPHKMVVKKGNFIISANTKVLYEYGKSEVKNIAEYFCNLINKVSGFNLKAEEFSADVKNSNAVLFSTADADNKLGNESYSLAITKNLITLKAAKPNGLFYGVQTLRQLLPVEIESTKKINKNIIWKMPCLSIEDKPRYVWRGMHLDVSRHFFPKEFIKQYIDFIAMHKMNIFHWHLTDDQGWRVEIKKYPKLGEIAAWRVDRENKSWGEREAQKPGEKATYGGYYTQEEIKEIVKYANERFITVIPEIEMPAHSREVLAAYPEYSCTGGPFTVPPGGYWPNSDIFCAGNDSTFEFLENVLSELMDLFPGKYIHIGGDEADKTEWKKCPKCQSRIKTEKLKNEAELQSYFIKRIEKFLISKNRRLIGWDEILEGGLAPEATVMSWRGMEGGIAAAHQKHDVVMSPTSHCYFDYLQGLPANEPLGIGGYLPLKKVYSFEPTPPELNAEESKHILGAQANLWTEFVPTPEHATYMVLPRIDALSEVVWSPKELRNWDDFTQRMEDQFKRYEIMNVNYAKSAFQVNISSSVDSIQHKIKVVMQNETFNPVIHYTLDGSKPTIKSKHYEKPFILENTAIVKAGAFKNNKMVGKSSELKFELHKAVAKKIIYGSDFNEKYPGDSFCLVDGVRGTKDYSDGKWQGYLQNDLDVLIDFGQIIDVNKISLGALQNSNSWIFLPKSVEFVVSLDNIEFRTVGYLENTLPALQKDIFIKDFSQSLKGIKARYIRIIAKNIAVCPEGHPGAGDKAWLFVDEIIVE
jgi:hexosaminidase